MSTTTALLVAAACSGHSVKPTGKAARLSSAPSLSQPGRVVPSTSGAAGSATTTAARPGSQGPAAITASQPTTSIAPGGPVSAAPTQPAAPALPSGPLRRYPRNPLVPQGPPGSYDYLKTGPRAVLKLGPTDYRMWYEAVPEGRPTTVAYAVSSDGLTWTKRGVVMSPSVAWDSKEVSPDSVLFENGVLKLWYHAYDGQVRRIGYAESTDGVTWRKRATPVLDVGPAGSWDDLFTFGARVFRVGSGYRMYYVGSSAGSRSTNTPWSLGIASSPDGVSWTKSASNPVLGPGTSEFAVIPAHGVWHMWWAESTDQITYWSSSDGQAWTQESRGPVLTGNPDQSAPDTYAGDAISVYLDGPTYRIMYTGANMNAPSGRVEAICLASIADPAAGSP